MQRRDSVEFVGEVEDESHFVELVCLDLGGFQNRYSLPVWMEIKIAGDTKEGGHSTGPQPRFFGVERASFDFVVGDEEPVFIFVKQFPFIS
jgi:hypothetical protein